MSSAEFKAPTVRALHQLLKPLGYRKAASVFSKVSDNVVHLIDVQGSSSSTAAEARFTVNVGIFAWDLVYADARDTVRPSMIEAHWRERLGFLSPERTDLWWKASTLAEAESAAVDIVEHVAKHALPVLAGLPNLDALVVEWKSGMGRGITDRMREDYLARLGCR